MKEVTIKVYELSELSEEAQERAYQIWYKDNLYPWYEENRLTIEKFCEKFGGLGVDWEYDSASHYAYIVGELTVNDDEEEVSAIEEYTGDRLLKYLEANYQEMLYPKNNESLTGFYVDGVILEPLVNFAKEPRSITLRNLLNECVSAWAKHCSADLYDYFSKENFEEESFNSDWYYLKDGTLFLSE